MKNIRLVFYRFTLILLFFLMFIAFSFSIVTVPDKEKIFLNPGPKLYYIHYFGKRADRGSVILGIQKNNGNVKLYFDGGHYFRSYYCTSGPYFKDSH